VIPTSGIEQKQFLVRIQVQAVVQKNGAQRLAKCPSARFPGNFNGITLLMAKFRQHRQG
jgi:hypothetical protein